MTTNGTGNSSNVLDFHTIFATRLGGYISYAQLCGWVVTPRTILVVFWCTAVPCTRAVLFVKLNTAALRRGRGLVVLRRICVFLRRAIQSLNPKDIVLKGAGTARRLAAAARLGLLKHEVASALMQHEVTYLLRDLSIL
jgi:hypothetical protein